MAVAIIGAMSPAPNAARQSLINTTVIALKAAGLPPKIDSLQVYAAHADQPARLDWMNPSRVATAVNSPTFTVDRGFAGDGLTSYVDTNYNPVTAGVNYTLNSAMVGIRMNSDPTARAGSNTGNGSANFTVLNISTRFGLNINDITADSAPSIAAGVRYGFGVRSSSTIKGAYRSTSGTVSLVGNVARSSTSIFSRNFYVGAANFNPAGEFVSYEHSMFVAGAGLTLSELQSIVTIMDAYMTAVGNTA